MIPPALRTQQRRGASAAKVLFPFFLLDRTIPVPPFLPSIRYPLSAPFTVTLRAERGYGGKDA